MARLLLGCIGKHDHIVEKASFACAHISHQEIATMVGSVRDVSPRALKELERDGAVTLARIPPSWSAGRTRMAAGDDERNLAIGL